MTTIYPRIVRLESSKIDQGAQALVHALASDPIFCYFYPDDQQLRLRSLHWFSKVVIQHNQFYGHVYTTSGQPRGVMIWHPPGQPLPNLRLLLKAKSAELSPGFQLTKFWEFLSLLFELEEYHQQNLPCLHWYLCLAGVLPIYQYQGIGSALLQPILRQADAEELPCYLETAHQAIPFFQKHGFEVTAAIRFSDDAPHLWAMKREPIKSDSTIY